MPTAHSVADVARLIKTNSSRWIHERWPQFKNFAWQPGYGAFSVSESGIDSVRAYILHQQQHHTEEIIPGRVCRVSKEESHCGWREISLDL